MATKYVSLGSIKRDGNKFTVKYSVKSGYRDDIDHVYVQWILPGGKTETTVDKKSLSKSGGNASVTLSRKKYYPVIKGNNLGSVLVRAIGRKDGKNKGAWSKTLSFDLAAPANPTVTKSVDAGEGTVSFQIKTADPDSTKKERYDTRYVITREANVGTAKSTLESGSSTSEDFTKSADIAEATSLSVGQYVKVTCETWARGLLGDGKHVKKSHVFARPNRPVIESAQLVYGDANDTEGGLVIVTFDAKETELAPVDTVKLHRLQSTNVTTAAEAANSGGWQEVTGAEDNGNVVALTDNAEDAVAVEAGTHVWYRIESKHDNLTSLSDPVECTGAYTDKSTTTAGTVTIDSAIEVGEDWVKLSLTDTETDDECIRVYWSDYENAWESNDTPKSFDVTWLDNGSANVYITGLDSGTRYWFRACAVDKDADDKEVLGGLSAALSATPTPDFGPISVTVPPNVPIGSDMHVDWSFTGGYAQDAAWVKLSYGGTVKLVEATESTATSMDVSWDKLEEWTGDTIRVSVVVNSCGAKFISDSHGVVISDLPTCDVTVTTLTAQPASFELSTDSASSPTVTASVISHGATGSGLDGDSYQLDGDCVWSGILQPTWTASGDTYTTTIELPSGLTFWDGATYEVNARLHDELTGLDSETATQTFDVAWAHQAEPPTGSVTADPTTLSAAVTVPVPSSPTVGDRFDLYRVTADGERRIAKGLPFGSTLTDRYAPFGELADLHYIAVTRTIDGDWEPSAALTYELPHKALRFDWGDGETLSLPYNIEDSYSYDKGFESETALNGEQIGWWDGGVTRSASLNTDLVKVNSIEEREAIASIAKYAGPVFVRTPMGVAFSANVVPNDMAVSYNSAAVSVSFSCTEVALTEEHMPTEDDITLPTWNGGSVTVSGITVYDGTDKFPMDDWTYIGTDTSVSTTFYVYDPDGVVRNQNGTQMTGYTWDGGSSITSSGGTVIDLDGSAR